MFLLCGKKTGLNHIYVKNKVPIFNFLISIKINLFGKIKKI